MPECTTQPLRWQPNLDVQQRKAARGMVDYDTWSPSTPSDRAIACLELLASGPKSNRDFHLAFPDEPLILVLGGPVELRAYGFAGWIEAEEPTHAITDSGKAWLKERGTVVEGHSNA